MNTQELTRKGYSEKSDVIVDGEAINFNNNFTLESLIRSNTPKVKNESYVNYVEEASGVIPELAYPVIGKFSGIFGKLDSMSTNDRFYSRNFWTKVLDSSRVETDLETGQMLGIFEHPNVTVNYTKEGIATARHPQNSSFVVKRLWISGDYVMGEGYILNTPLGKLLATYFLAKDDRGRPLIQLYISARGYSQFDYFDENKIDHMNPDDYILQSFDIVMCPGIKGAKVKLESDNTNSPYIAKLESFSRDVDTHYREINRYKDELRLELDLKSI